MSARLRFPGIVDHLVLPVNSLRTARKRLTQLGFTVAADAQHPFGTENACVFFADQTYLEPLAIASKPIYEHAASNGNAFVALDAMFRDCRDEGLSSIAFASQDAVADHQWFSQQGISAGDLFEFARMMVLPDGRQGEGRFRLAFAKDENMAQFFSFTCQRVQPLPSDRGSLERHANGVTGLAKIDFRAAKPSLFAGYFERICGPVQTEEVGLSVEAQNLHLTIRAAPATEPSDGGLIASRLVFKVEDLDMAQTLLRTNGVDYTHKDRQLLVRQAPGQGVDFAFEE
ncbi:VOC family protein [Rhizobium sp. CFBP 8762]|uniref:VOC family protein n=1 Tax=Rhizobium sp. CFBP 8762 TaxID=2775279 RepID=UPI001781A914|nr:VOC family protein [Rhizobium sp. CFBP 8762]MBD8555677.1 VOC family protein [Rhizobium sp. CFBP 8762]